MTGHRTGTVTLGGVTLALDGPFRYRMERVGAMRVPGIVYASDALLPDDAGDRTLERVANVATLPGIVAASYAMPDLHRGYGFPIGGVAGTDVAAGGVVSPGGVGFDISCGVRLLATRIDRDSLAPVLGRLMDFLGRSIPRGAGRGGVWGASDPAELGALLAGGSRFCVERGLGTARDLHRCEDGGAVADADPDAVSERAVRRGLGQVGSLGSGNHFCEVQVVDRVYDQPVADVFGVTAGQVCVMIHTGSRGLGHQICTDHVRAMEAAMPRFGIAVPDRQLACAPVDSPEGRAYLAAMAAAANYGRANRQLLGEAVRRAFGRAAGVACDLVYDVSHNLAKLERHRVDGTDRLLCVHRKGATRALPPGHPDLPADLSGVGQPALIPGSMGTASYLLTGVAGGGAFHSTCHGAGRAWSRHQAARQVRGGQVADRLSRAGVEVRGASVRGLAEETPEAYKDVDAVVDAATGAGLCRQVARLVPIGVVKG